MNRPSYLLYMSGFTISIILFAMFAMTTYGFSKTRVDALVKNITYLDDNTSALNIVYYYNSVKVNAVIYSNYTGWYINQTIPVYMNPRDLSSPRYAPAIVNIVFYLILCILFACILLFLSKIVNAHEKGTIVYVPVHLKKPSREYYYDDA